MTGRAGTVTAALLATAVLVAGCGSTDNEIAGSTAAGPAAAAAQHSATAVSGSGPGSPTASGQQAALAGTITVLAASSLKGPFSAIATLFQRSHPATMVKVSYDGSSTLVSQIIGGEQADVFASADQKNMSTVTAAGLAAGTPILFASNTLQIAVAPGNPKKISSLADLAKSDVVTVLCAPAVPCGRASHTALDAARVTVRPASEEQNVTAVLTKVESGDADAGLVYVTDVSSAGGQVLGVKFPEASKAVNHYPIVALKAAPNAAGARAFIDLVLGPEGQKTLAGLGFARP